MGGVSFCAGCLASFLQSASACRTLSWLSAMICAACSCSSGVGRLRMTFAWPMLIKPLFSSSSTFSGRFSSRRLLARALRLLPSFWAACSWVRLQRVISSRMPAASSTGSRSSRWRFSTSASSIACSSVTSFTMTGTSVRPAIRLARQRRSPATMRYRPTPWGRTAMGCSSPCSAMLAASSPSVS